MKDHVKLEKHMPELHDVIHDHLAKAGFGHLRVQTISFAAAGESGLPITKPVCKKKPDGTLVCENIAVKRAGP